MRFIIPDTKKETKFILNLTAKDLLIVLVGIILITLVAFSTFPMALKITCFVLITICVVFSVITIDTQKGWAVIVNFFRFVIRKKKFQKEEIGSKMELGDYIHIQGEAYISVIQLNGINFSIQSELNQNAKILTLLSVLLELPKGKIVKMEEKLKFDEYVETNNEFIKKADRKLTKKMRRKYGADVTKWENYDTDPETLKKKILENQNTYLSNFGEFGKDFKPAYYIIIEEPNVAALDSATSEAVGRLKTAGLYKRLITDTLEEQALTEFLKRYMSFKSDVSDVPDIVFEPTHEKSTKLKIGDKYYRTICIHRYKVFNDNAWAWKLFNIESTHVCLNYRPYAGKSVEKLFNRQFSEMKMRMEDNKVKAYEQNQIQGDYEAMQTMMTDIQFGYDKLMDVELFITYPIEKDKEVKRTIRSMGCTISDMFLCQYEAYLSTLPFIPMTTLKKAESINTLSASAVAGMFPFVTAELFDPKGVYLGGSNGLPVFKNIFVRDEDRKNSNCVIFGTSGGGKSYFLKKELLNFYIENKKIFVLDPDNEYRRFHKVFGIGYIDLAGAENQRINPLQVFPAFKEDDDDGRQNEVSAHLVFLEQFFQTVLPSLDGAQRDTLLGYVGELYKQFKIDNYTDVAALEPEQFPTFDDLYKLVKARQEELIANRKVEDEFELRQLSPILLCIQKFTDGGMYSSLWNGKTTLKIKNDFTVFNFQSLFATGNLTVTNAQMLLVIKYLNQEVIKNRENQEDNIIIAIDEAHRFIDGKFTVGLDFMQQEAKQIRKYFGSLIVATQNINDFCGATPEMRQKAAAVINCCQYSYVFNLAPDDINSILDLYKNYNGGLQQEEINYISTARRGDCLFMASKDIRLPVHITCFPDEDFYFEEPKQNAQLKA